VPRSVKCNPGYAFHHSWSWNENNAKKKRRRQEQVTTRDKMDVHVPNVVKPLNRIFSVVLRMCFFRQWRKIPVPCAALEEKTIASCLFLYHRAYPFIISSYAKKNAFIFLNGVQQY
jgi:hypothetical protein